MDFNKYIKELVRNQVQNSEHLQRTKGIIESINGNKITIKLISSIDQPSVTIVNNNGLELSVGQNVTINHWGDVSKGYISFNSFEKFGGGVGQWLPIDPDNTTEIFNDYKDNGIVVSDVNEALRGYSYEKSNFYSHISGVCNHIYVDAPSVQFSDVRLVGRANQLHLGSSTSSSEIRCADIYISGAYNNATINCTSLGSNSFILNGWNNSFKVTGGYSSYNNIINGNYNLIESTYSLTNCTILGHDNQITPKCEISNTTLIGGYNQCSITPYDGSSFLTSHSIFGYSNSISCSNFEHNDRLALLGTDNEISGYADKSARWTLNGLSLVGNSNRIYLSNTKYCYSTVLHGDSNRIISYNSKGNQNAIFGISNSITSYMDLNDTIICGYHNEITSSQLATDKHSTYLSVFGCGNQLNFESTPGSNLVLIGTGNGIIAQNDGDYMAWQSVIGTGAYINYANSAQASDISIAFSGNYMTLSKSNGGNLSVGGSITSNGADYAEDWEWEDGNCNIEDRRGLFVTIADDGYHIKIANKDDEILGIVSSNPSVVGGGDNFEWRGKYLKDVFGDHIYEDVQVPITTQERKLVKDEYTDDDGIHHPPEYETIEVETGEYRTEKRRVLNPDYDDTLVYTNREYRPEHCYIAHLGKVVMVDDGTAEPNGYVTSADGGIATKSETKTRARVLQRLDDNHIRVWWE